MKIYYLTPFVLISLLFFSCDKDEHVAETVITLEAQTFEVLETIAQGDQVGVVVATSNSTKPITFRIIENTDNLFTIDSDGRIDMSSPLLLDFNNATSHEILVEATDGEESATAIITINVIDVPDPFITTWKTDDYGVSDDNQVTITTVGNLTYDYTVDWGDGTEDANVTGDITHTYAAIGTYTISILGTFPAIINVAGDTDNYKIQTIEQWGDIQWETMESAFESCGDLVSNASDAPDLSQVTSMASMFSEASNFTGDLSNWDVSSITDMNNTFLRADEFNSDISAWNVSNVTNMSGMFNNADQFDGDLSNWDVSNVTDMSFMFRDARAFQGNIGSWDVSNVTDMGYMLYGAPISGGLSSWDVSNVTDMANMFRLSSFNGDVSGWNVSNVTTMRNMFRDSGLSQANYTALLSGWSSLTVQNGVELGMGNLKYDGAMQSARDILTNSYNWNITDGGADF